MANELADELSKEELARVKKFGDYYMRQMRKAINDPKLQETGRQMWETFSRQTNHLAIWDVLPGPAALYFYTVVSRMTCDKNKPSLVATVGAKCPPDVDESKATMLTIGILVGVYLSEIGMASLLTREHRKEPPEHG